MAVPGQGHRRPHAGPGEDDDPDVDRPFRLSAGERGRGGGGLPGAAEAGARRQHLGEDLRLQPGERHRPAALRRLPAAGPRADRGQPRPDHVGHRLAAPEQVRGEPQRRRPGGGLRPVGPRRGDAPKDHGGDPGAVLPVLIRGNTDSRKVLYMYKLKNFYSIYYLKMSARITKCITKNLLYVFGISICGGASPNFLIPSVFFVPLPALFLVPGSVRVETRLMVTDCFAR